MWIRKGDESSKSILKYVLIFYVHNEGATVEKSIKLIRIFLQIK